MTNTQKKAMLFVATVLAVVGVYLHAPSPNLSPSTISPTTPVPGHP